MRYWKITGTQSALDIVEKTLQNMRLGGIYDQLGFGFHRYSTDSSWIVPHFEKMLYDQALISLAYQETYQATGKEDYRTVVEEIFEYIIRNMSSPMGGFYSAEDADSEGQEGKFYLWTHEELDEALAASITLIKKTYNISEKGNYFDELNQGYRGKNIFYIGRSLDDVAAEVGLEKGELVQRLENARHLLLSVRDRRVPPARDDKILTDWNGLMIAALAKAAQIFDEPKYCEIARYATEFILLHLKTYNGRLLHRFREGEATIPGNIDDYAFFIFGLIELYEATFAAKYLSEAIYLQTLIIDHFWDTDRGGFFFTADDSERLLIRQKEVRDGAVPSGNSIALLNLVRLARLTGTIDYEAKATQLTKAFLSEIGTVPSAYTMFLTATDFLTGPSCEIVLVGNPESDETRTILEVFRNEFIPNKV
ncbi:AGE family epimerase/isomerase, partial [Candidatus Bathyarchaeota archaeon]|nr:AGE family epimerase/isomerase [Candidatus Bathyarchaeota archaeon]